MNKNKLKKNSIFLLVFFVGIGIILILRANNSENKLTQINGKLINIELKKITQPFKLREIDNYSILLNLEETDVLYGIYGGTKKQAINNKKRLNLNLQQEYTFLIDASVKNGIDNTNLGIRVIKKGDTIVFKENMKPYKSFGMFFIIIGVISSALLYFISKKK